MASLPNQWTFAHRPILFIPDGPGRTGVEIIDNGSGKARIWLAPSAQQFAGIYNITRVYVTSFSGSGLGSYVGYFDVLASDTDTIDLDTPYIVDEDCDFKIIWEFSARLSWGYPNQTDTADLRVDYDPSGNVVIDVHEWLLNTFRIAPPVPGVDKNMFNHYKLELLPGADYQAYMDGEVETIFQVSGVDPNKKWYVLNGTLDNVDAINEFIGAGNAFLTDNTGKAKCFTGATTIVSYIDDDVVRNAFYKDGIFNDPA